MSLSNELISQFVKATKDDKKTNTESTVYGTTVIYGGKTYVRLDGSDLLTPVSTTTNVKDSERVTVMIKDHTATITGNITSPSASAGDIKEVADQISEFDNIVSHTITTEELEATTATIQNLRAYLAKIDKLHAVFADIESLEAKFVKVDHLNANDIQAIYANIEKIESHFGSFAELSADELKALNAEIEILKGYTADFTYVSADVLKAIKASIKELDVGQLSVEEADIRYANIDFSNIGNAAIEKLFSKSGIIEDLVVSEGKITGELVGVTIKGDLIEGNTIKADKLVVKGSDGLYYKLNFESGNFTDGEVVPDDGLHGSVIVANSITAEKISVDDLVAFDATIGGFHITNSSIYSGVKASADNSTTGVYLGSDGQIAFGDETNFIKYYKDQNGNYKLEISADSILFGANKNSVEEIINASVDSINSTNEEIHRINESMSNLLVNSSDIEAKVSEIESSVHDTTGQIDFINEEISSLKLSSDELNLEFQNIASNGATKVTTETGFTFDSDGMSIDSTDSLTKTQVTPDGMTVYKKDADGAQEEVLEATSEGVNAKNLRATTYLIIGGRSRFENYGADRTGCFWIGG